MDKIIKLPLRGEAVGKYAIIDDIPENQYLTNYQ